MNIPWEATTQVALITGEWEHALDLVDAELAASPPPFHEAVLVFQAGRAWLGRGDVARAVQVLEQARDHLQTAYRSYRELGMAFFVENTEKLVEELGLEPIRSPWPASFTVMAFQE